MTLKEILVALKTYVGGDQVKAREAAEAIHAGLKDDEDATANQAVAQALIDKGAGKGKGEIRTKLTTAEAALTTATERIEELESDLRDAQEKAPKTDEKIAALKEQHRIALQKVKDELATERQGRQTDKRDTVIERFLKKLKPGVEVDEEYANAVIAAKYADRFAFGEDGTLEIRQLGSEAVYAPAEGKDPVDLLAADVLKQVPPKFRLTGVEAGGGQGGGGSRVSRSDKDIVDTKTEQFNAQRAAQGENPLVRKPAVIAQ